MNAFTKLMKEDRKLLPGITEEVIVENFEEKQRR